MDLGIKGKNAIVCASSKGLGRACAHALASNGVNVVINGRDEAALSKTASDIASETGVSVTAVAGDVSDAAVQERLLKTCPKPDILVNNNGGPPFADYRDLDREAMISGVVMNMVTPIELIQRVMDGMMERGFGRIVNITSISVKMPVPGLDLSSGARAGLTAFLAGVLPQAAGRNVTINHILPGYFATERHNNSLTALAKRTGQSPEDALQSRIETVPAKRLGQPDEFGQACAFLCSEHAGYITGQNLLLDGGRFEGTW
jgi:3-oxoacyl-[acyl-carrier protein] reductase